MGLDVFAEKGTPLEQQGFTWHDLVRPTCSKLNDDAFTRVRVLLMAAIEREAQRFSYACSHTNRHLQRELAQVRRVELHQFTLVNGLNPADQSALETAVAMEQMAVETTASLAQHEPDPYLAQVYRFALLEDVDHLYRYAALMDRIEGRDANNILQSYTDIRPGRPTSHSHRDPDDDLRAYYDRRTAAPLTRLHALVAFALKQHALDYGATLGPHFADPLARQLFAEVASVEEQHLTQYGSIVDPEETWLERWLLHELAEVYVYYACLTSETNPRVRAVWERMVDYELGHLHHVMGLVQKFEDRDPASMIPRELPELVRFDSHRHFVREALARELDVRAQGPEFVRRGDDRPDTVSAIACARLNADGSPSELVAAGYRWSPGTELAARAAASVKSHYGAPR